MKRTIPIMCSLFMSCGDPKWLVRIAGPILMLAGSAVAAAASVLWGG
jgi:hypothetical protein